MTSNLGKWDRWYVSVQEPETYGDDTTYRLGADWLRPCSLIADWGCGKGGLRLFVPAERYCGVDGSQTPFADVIADLTEYRSDIPGVFMRHVLEHNDDWALILDNALASATERLFLALFTPLAEKTHRIAFADDPGVPDISFRLSDLTDRMDAAGFAWTVETLPTDTQYGVETVVRCQW